MRVALFFLLFSNCGYAAIWDSEYWQYLNLTQFESDPYTFYGVVEVRLNHDISRFSYLKIAENFAYAATSNLDLELHYCYLHTQPFGAPDFKNINRLEFEINPNLRLGKTVTLIWRNRLELIKENTVSYIQFVFRHRITLLFPLENWGRLKSFQMSDEIIYDFETRRITQNRFIPLELSYELCQDFQVDMFLMYRRVFSSSLQMWYNSLVLGSEFSF